jgi:hypothetical protein
MRVAFAIGMPAARAEVVIFVCPVVAHNWRQNRPCLVIGVSRHSIAQEEQMMSGLANIDIAGQHQKRLMTFSIAVHSTS